MWRREVEAAHTYKLLAEREPDPKRRDLLLRLAEQEDKHASAVVGADRARHRSGARSRRKSSAGCPGFSGSPIRTSCSIASSRKRTGPKPNTTS